MRAGVDAQKFARPVAEIIGLAADDFVVRYGVLTLTFVSLAVAAYLFGPAAPLEAVGVLIVAYAIIFFTIYWWFLEEARKRRIMLNEEPPRPQDSLNPDLRDEVLFACAVLFLVTPLLLQTLNPTSLHYAVAQDELGLKALACAGAQAGSFCAQNARLFELPSWLFFTLQSFLTTLPMADQVSDIAANMTGVHPTAATPAFAATGLRLMFGGFLLTLVVGMFNKVGRQIDSAVEALALSPQLAAGMGPIILGRLQKVLKDETNEVRRQNAIEAAGDIAKRYPGAQSEVRRLFADDFAAWFDKVPKRTRDEGEIKRLTILASALCAMRWDPGLDTVRDRILTLREFERTKQRLLTTLAESLDATEALRQLNLMSTQLMKPKLTALYDSLLAQLTPDGDGDDGVTPAAAAPVIVAAQAPATPEAPHAEDEAAPVHEPSASDVHEHEPALTQAA